MAAAILVLVIMYILPSKVNDSNSTENTAEQTFETNTSGAEIIHTAEGELPKGDMAKSPNARRIAVLYFDNNSGEAKMKALSKGLADMMITDLSKYYMLNVIERDKLEEIMKEQDISQTGRFDQSTALKLGKLLGVECILAGSYFEMMGSFRMDARIIDVETGKIIRSEGVNGPAEKFFDLEKQLVGKIVAGLEISLKDGEKDYLNSTIASKFTLNAGLNYSNALNKMDKGNVEEAKQMFETILTNNPEFEPAQMALNSIEL